MRWEPCSDCDVCLCVGQFLVELARGLRCVSSRSCPFSLAQAPVIMNALGSIKTALTRSRVSRASRVSKVSKRGYAGDASEVNVKPFKVCSVAVFQCLCPPIWLWSIYWCAILRSLRVAEGTEGVSQMSSNFHRISDACAVSFLEYSMQT